MAQWTTDDLRNKGFDKDGNKIDKTKETAEIKSKTSKTPKKKIGNTVGDLNVNFPHAIFISGNVPSSKNSRNFGIARNADGSEKIKANGKRITSSFDSKTVQDFKKIAIPQFEANLHKFKRMVEGMKTPYTIYFKIIRKYAITEKGGHRFDYHNMVQIIADMMEKYGWIENDDAENAIFIPVQYGVNEEYPGVVIFV